MQHHDDDDTPLVAPTASQAVSLFVDMKFDASDRHDAKDWLLPRFSDAHGGKCRCRNSSADYVYCQCLICKATCGAAPCNMRQWRVSTVAPTVNSPCVRPTPLLPTPSITEVVSVAVPVVALPNCVLCGEPCETAVKCSNDHAIGVSCTCFEQYVMSAISGDSLGTFMKIGCIVRCPSCYTPEFGKATTPLNMQIEGSKLSKEGFAKYVKAVAEPEVIAAVEVAVQEAKSRMTSNKVDSTLADIFQPERCSNCNSAFEHHGGCTSMPCPNCKTIFCLWCRSAFQTSGEGHAHAWHCEKAPSNDEMLTSSRVFPAGHDAEQAAQFLHAYFKVRKLEMLQFQLQQGAYSVIHAQSHTTNLIYRMVVCRLQTTSYT
jgi:hypothetical protein